MITASISSLFLFASRSEGISVYSPSPGCVLLFVRETGDILGDCGSALWPSVVEWELLWLAVF